MAVFQRLLEQQQHAIEEAKRQMELQRLEIERLRRTHVGDEGRTLVSMRDRTVSDSTSSTKSYRYASSSTTPVPRIEPGQVFEQAATPPAQYLEKLPITEAPSLTTPNLIGISNFDCAGSSAFSPVSPNGSSMSSSSTSLSQQRFAQQSPQTTTGYAPFFGDSRSISAAISEAVAREEHQRKESYLDEDVRAFWSATTEDMLADEELQTEGLRLSPLSTVATADDFDASTSFELDVDDKEGKTIMGEDGLWLKPSKTGRKVGEQDTQLTYFECESNPYAQFPTNWVKLNFQQRRQGLMENAKNDDVATVKHTPGTTKTKPTLVKHTSNKADHTPPSFSSAHRRTKTRVVKEKTRSAQPTEPTFAEKHRFKMQMSRQPKNKREARAQQRLRQKYNSNQEAVNRTKKQAVKKDAALWWSENKRRGRNSKKRRGRGGKKKK